MPHASRTIYVATRNANKVVEIRACLAGLPVRLERQLLDYFKGENRRGVGCVFQRYFAVDFESLIPLHKYISAAYRRSTVDTVAARLKPGESDAVLRDLQTAADAFGRD